MKTIILTAVLGAVVASTSAVQAESFVSDSLLKDFASTGQVINPHGFAGGRW